MTKQWNGKVAVDIRDATPDWEPFLPPKAREHGPRQLAFSCGTIETVFVDVTVEHFVDHEAQVRAWLLKDYTTTGPHPAGWNHEEAVMADNAIDELGPVDYLVVEFPAGASHFTGEMAKELAALAESGTIRILDVLVLRKDDDGSVEALEIDDLDEVDDLRAIEAEIAEILAEEDVEHLAAAMEPGTVAGVLVWENRWAAPFASAARRSGGQLVATGRIPIQAIVASIEAEEAEGA